MASKVVADPGDGPGRPAPPSLLLDQAEAQTAEKKFLETASPPFSKVLDEYYWILQISSERGSPK